MGKFEEKIASAKRRIHLISIGNKIMCDLAIALKMKGYDVSGSDLSIPEPFYTQLKDAEILPAHLGWNPEAIDENLMAVVPAIHIDNSNPELIAAKEKGILITSLSEFIFERTKNKTRIVIAGTTYRKTLLMLVMNVLRQQNICFDYATSSVVDGFDQTMSLNYDSRIAIIEGDESFTASIDKRPILHFLRPHIAFISDISDANIPQDKTYEEYFDIFRQFTEQIERNGKFIFHESDSNLQNLAGHVREDVTAIPYNRHEIIENPEKLVLKTRYGEFPLRTINKDIPTSSFLELINGARLLCRQLGVQDKDFYEAIAT